MSLKQKIILNLEQVNTMNAEGCIACGHKFNMGDSVVRACGAWEGGRKLIHENEAVFDKRTDAWYERRFFLANKDCL